ACIEPAMAAVTLDSEAAFRERCLKIGMEEATLDVLITSNYKTFGHLAFAISSSPNTADEEQVQQWVNTVFARPPTPQQMACIRRALFEAQALSISDMKSRVEPQSDVLVRKMPVAERIARQNALERRLTGVIFAPETTPGHSVVDRLVDMLETGVMAYLEPHKYVSRSQEVQNVKSEKSLSITTDGNLKVNAKVESLTCEASSALTLRQAWSRRSIAFELAGLATFTILEGWVQKMFIMMQRPPPDGYVSISLQQLLAADRHLFTVAADRLLGNLQCVPGREKPLDTEVKRLADSTEMLQFLTCLPKATSPPPLKRPWENDKGGDAPQLPPGAKAKHDDKPNCFGYNHGTCKFKAGLHTDSHNDASSLNAVLAISNFEGGEIFVENELGSHRRDFEGETLRGDILSPQDGPAIFSARSIDKLPGSDIQTLTALGFPLLFPSSQAQADLQGFDVVPIDHQARAPLAPTVQLDLPIPASAKAIGVPAGAQITIENPTNSWYWSILALQIRRCKDAQLESLALACDKSHEHLPWSVKWAKSGFMLSQHRAVSIVATRCKALQPPIEGVSSGSELCRVGFYRSPEQWLDEAASLDHPMDVAAALPKITLDAILMNFSSDHKSLALKRKIALMKAEILAKKLEKDEEALHRSMPEWMQGVVHDQRILLWEALLRQSDYDDMEVVDFLKQGVPLVGASDCPTCFETKVRPAVLTEAELRAAAPDLRRGMMSRSLHQEPEHTAHLSDATKEELASGFIQGPFTEQQVTAHFGHRHWLAIRRFIIKQGPKLRPIEDCCEAHLNEAYAATIKLRLQDADFFVAMALEVARLSGNNPKAARPWVAKSIWWLLTKVLRIPCSHFYDDFPMLVPEDMGSEADASASRFLSLLGWRHAKTGEGGKGHPFMSRFDVLGLSADVAKLHLGTLVLSNKEGRAQKIQDLLGVVSGEGHITRNQGQILLGLLRFASGFYGGRTLRHVCADLNRLVFSRDHVTPQRLRALSDMASKALTTLPPRTITFAARRPLVHAFTDGCWQDGVAGLRAVVFDCATGRGRVFQGKLPANLVKAWLSEVGEQIIGQIELYAVLVMRFFLKDDLAGRRTVFWCDNEAARFGLIRNESHSRSMDVMLRAFARVEDESLSFTWISRVPSASNPSDAPSRGDGHSVLQLSRVIRRNGTAIGWPVRWVDQTQYQPWHSPLRWPTSYAHKVFAIESPEFAKGDSEERHVNFHYVIYTVEMGRLMLQSWDGANWTTVWSPPGGQGRVWNRADVRLPDDAQALRFLGITRIGYASGVAVALAVDSLQISNFSTTVAELPDYDTVTCSFEADFCSWRAMNDQAWMRRNGATPSAYTGPSGAFDGGHYIYLEADWPNYPNKEFVLESPIFRKGDGSARYVHFHYHMYGFDMGQLTLQFWHGMLWTTVWSLSGNQGDRWHHVLMRLPDDAQALRFLGMTGIYSDSDIAIDKVRAAAVPIVAIDECTSPAAACGWTSTATVDQVSGVVLQMYVHSCNTDMDGTYDLQGQTRSGRAYYKLSSANVYLYHDPSCDGNSSSPRWIFDNNFPSLTASQDLDGDGSCSYTGVAYSDDVAPPLFGTWLSWCNDSSGWSSGYRFLEETPYVSVQSYKTFSDAFYLTAMYVTDRGDPKVGKTPVSTPVHRQLCCDSKVLPCERRADPPECLCGSLQEFHLQSPSFSQGSGLYFDYLMYSLDGNFGSLQLQAWDGQNWTAVWSLFGSQGNSWHQGTAHFSSNSTRLRFQGSLGAWKTGDLAVRAFRTAVALEELACEDFQLNGFWLEPGTVGPSRAMWRAVDIGLEARGAESQTAVLDSAQISTVGSEVVFFLSFQVVGPTAALEVQQLTENGWTHFQTTAIASFGSWQNLTGPISVQTQSLRLLATMNSTTDLVRIRSFHLDVAQFARSLEDAGCDFEAFRGQAFASASQEWSVGTATEVLLTSPLFPSADVVYLAFAFWMRGWAPLSLRVEMWIYGLWQESWSEAGQRGVGWQQVKLRLPATVNRVRFRGYMPADVSSRIAVDHIMLYSHAHPQIMPAAMVLVGGYHHQCALAFGQLKCFGRNREGQLGYGSSDDVGDDQEEVGLQLPVVDVGGTVLQACVGLFHTCAVLQGGSLKCWGSNVVGQIGSGNTATLGDDPNEMGDWLPAVDLGNGTKVSQLACGSGHTCVLLHDGAIKCFGYNGDGQLGLGDTMPGPQLREGRTVTANWAHSCALSSEGVVCWGWQFLSSEIISNVSSLPTIGFELEATQIATGEQHACIRLADGRMRCWGNNEWGQLGLGDTVSRGAHEAADVDLGFPTTQIFVGYYYSCAMLQDERTLCWGWNGDRELGRGTAIPVYESPGEVLVRKVESLSMGNAHICFLQSGGAISCFGANDYGQLGVPTGEVSAEDGAALVPRLFRNRTPRAEGLESVRLSGGSRTWGFLEVLREGTWSPVCDDGFDAAAAIVACKDRRQHIIQIHL
ncbi:unnamed protein product, partial [Symbiodinium necroappetens]